MGAVAGRLRAYNIHMATQPPFSQHWDRLRDRRGLVRRSLIRRLAQQIAEHFQPDRIILFGSYAYGQPDRDSDVDLLVVMPARNEIDQALRIWTAIDPPFALDVIVRTPANLRWRLEEGDSFLREIVSQGKVLHGPQTPLSDEFRYATVQGIYPGDRLPPDREKRESANASGLNGV